MTDQLELLAEELADADPQQEPQPPKRRTRADIPALARQYAEKHGIDPGLFERQIKQESNFNPRARSSKGALGVAQFVPATGRKYGLKNAADFFDVDKSLDAGARHHADLYRKYNGNEDLVLAAYNAGEGAVDDYLNGTNLTGKNPRHRQTGGIPPFRETHKYIAAIKRGAPSGDPLDALADELARAPSAPVSTQKAAPAPVKPPIAAPELPVGAPAVSGTDAPVQSTPGAEPPTPDATLPASNQSAGIYHELSRMLGIAPDQGMGDQLPVAGSQPPALDQVSDVAVQPDAPTLAQSQMPDAPTLAQSQMPDAPPLPRREMVQPPALGVAPEAENKSPELNSALPPAQMPRAAPLPSPDKGDQLDTLSDELAGVKLKPAKPLTMPEIKQRRSAISTNEKKLATESQQLAVRDKELTAQRDALEQKIKAAQEAGEDPTPLKPEADVLSRLIEEFRGEATDFNQRVQAHHVDTEDFNGQVTAFNRSIRKNRGGKLPSDPATLNAAARDIDSFWQLHQAAATAESGDTDFTRGRRLRAAQDKADQLKAKYGDLVEVGSSDGWPYVKPAGWSVKEQPGQPVRSMRLDEQDAPGKIKTEPGMDKFIGARGAEEKAPQILPGTGGTPAGMTRPLGPQTDSEKFAALDTDLKARNRYFRNEELAAKGKEEDAKHWWITNVVRHQFFNAVTGLADAASGAVGLVAPELAERNREAGQDIQAEKGSATLPGLTKDKPLREGSLLGNLVYGGARLAPQIAISAVVPGSPAVTFGVTSALDAFGHGQTPLDAIQTGLEAATTAKLAGLASSGVTAEGWRGYLGRAGAIAGTTAGVRDYLHPDTPLLTREDIAFGLLFAAFHPNKSPLDLDPAHPPGYLRTIMGDMRDFLVRERGVAPEDADAIVKRNWQESIETAKASGDSPLEIRARARELISDFARSETKPGEKTLGGDSSPQRPIDESGIAEVKPGEKTLGGDSSPQRPIDESDLLAPVKPGDRTLGPAKGPIVDIEDRPGAMPRLGGPERGGGESTRMIAMVDATGKVVAREVVEPSSDADRRSVGDIADRFSGRAGEPNISYDLLDDIARTLPKEAPTGKPSPEGTKSRLLSMYQAVAAKLGIKTPLPEAAVDSALKIAIAAPPGKEEAKKPKSNLAQLSREEARATTKISEKALDVLYKAAAQRAIKAGEPVHADAVEFFNVDAPGYITRGDLYVRQGTGGVHVGGSVGGSAGMAMDESRSQPSDRGPDAIENEARLGSDGLAVEEAKGAEYRAAETEPQVTAPAFAPGDTVSHPLFAAGKPLKVTSVEGQALKVEVPQKSGSRISTISLDSKIGRELAVVERAPVRATAKEGAASEPTGFKVHKVGDLFTHPDIAGGKPLKVIAVANRGRNLVLKRQDDKGKAIRLMADSPEGRALQPVSELDTAAHEAATSPQNELPQPTEAQIEQGNYRKGHVNVGGLDIAIENPAGSQRRPEWPTLKAHYGYLKRSTGADDEAIDVFVKEGTPLDYAGPVFVVDQQNAKGGFDEHKTMLGYATEAEARAGYAENYTKGWKVGPITKFDSPDAFRYWLNTADTSKPAKASKIIADAKARIEAKAPTSKVNVLTAPQGKPASPAVKRLIDEKRKVERERDTDPVSGLESQSAWKRAQPAVDANPNRAVIAIDLNDFKRVNDEHGHAAGDRVLKNFGDALKKAVPDAQMIARSGGDEMRVIVPVQGANFSNANKATEAIKRIKVKEGDITVTGSAGFGATDAEADATAMKHKAELKAAGVIGERGKAPAPKTEAQAAREEIARRREAKKTSGPIVPEAPKISPPATIAQKPASNEKPKSATASESQSLAEDIYRQGAVYAGKEPDLPDMREARNREMTLANRLGVDLDTMRERAMDAYKKGRSATQSAAETTKAQGQSIADRIKAELAKKRERESGALLDLKPESPEASFVWDGEYLSTNRAGVTALSAAYGKQARGLTLKPAQAIQIAAKARLLAKDATAEARDNLAQLATALTDAARDRHEFAIGLPRSAMHELGHVAQLALQRAFGKDITAADAEKLPHYKQIARGLQIKGYTWLKDARAIAHEGYTHVAGGQWDEIGIGVSQAMDFAAAYFGLIAETYDAEGLARFNRLSAELENLRDEVINQRATAGKQRATGAGTGQEESQGDAAASAEEEAGSGALADLTPQVETEEFKRWSKGARLIEDATDYNQNYRTFKFSEPVVVRVYHGTEKDFDRFDFAFHATNTSHGARGKGFYFTGDPKLAANYAFGGQGRMEHLTDLAAQYTRQGRSGANVMAVYVRFEKPALEADMKLAQNYATSQVGYDQEGGLLSKPWDELVTDHLKARGFDGVIMPDVDEFVVFSPTQIKSVFNRGAFDPNNPNILADLEAIPLPAVVIEGLTEITRLYLDAGGGNIAELIDTFEELLGPDFDSVSEHLPAIIQAEENRTNQRKALRPSTFEQAAIDRLIDIARQGPRAPDGTQYVSPQLTIEVAGKKRNVNVAALADQAGLEPVKGKLNYYWIKDATTAARDATRRQNTVVAAEESPAPPPAPVAKPARYTEGDRRAAIARLQARRPEATRTVMVVEAAKPRDVSVKSSDSLLSAIQKIGIDPTTPEGADLARYLGPREGGRPGMLRKEKIAGGQTRGIDHLLDRLKEEGWQFEDKDDLYEAIRFEQSGRRVYSTAHDFDVDFERQLKEEFGTAAETVAAIGTLRDIIDNPEARAIIETLSNGGFTDEAAQRFTEIARYSLNVPDDIILDVLEDARETAAQFRADRLGREDNPQERPAPVEQADSNRERETGQPQVDVARTPDEELYRQTYGHDLSIVTEAQAAGLTTDQFGRVEALYESLRGRGENIDDYLRQQGLFGDELNEKQKMLLKQLASREKRAPVKEKQNDLFADLEPPPPTAEDLQDLGVLAAFHVDAGATEFNVFRAAMIEDAGEWTRPYLRKLHADAIGATPAQAPQQSAKAAAVKPDEHWNFDRSTFTSPETEAAFRRIVQNAVAQAGIAHKETVTFEQHRARVGRMSPDLLPEIGKLRDAQIVSREVFSAASEYAQTLTRQAQDLRAEITSATDFAEAAQKLDRIAQLEHDATEIMAHTVGVRSEFGRNLALLAAQKGDQLSPEKVLAFGLKLAHQRGLESDSKTWKRSARKLVASSNQIQGARKERTRIRQERKKVKEATAKPVIKRESWQARMVAGLQSSASDAMARLEARHGRGPLADLGLSISLIEEIKSLVEPSGSLSRGGDYVNSLMRNRPTEDVIDLLRWTRRAGVSPYVARFVGGSAAGELRSRNVPVDSIEWQLKNLRNATEDPNIFADIEPDTDAYDIAMVLAARVAAEAAKGKIGLPLDRIVEDLLAEFPDVVSGNEDDIKATADSLLKNARREALRIAARNPQQNPNARRELALEAAASRRALRLAEREANLKQAQMDRLWQRETEAAAREAEGRRDKAAADGARQQEIIDRELSKADRDGERDWRRQQRKAVIEEAKRLKQAEMLEEQARLEAVADEAREQARRDREAVREAIKAGQTKEARARKADERKAAAAARRWDYSITQAEAAARARIAADPNYQPTTDDLAAILSVKGAQPDMTPTRLHDEMKAEFGDAYTKGAGRIRDRAAEMRVEARRADAIRRIEQRAAGKAEGATKPAEQQQARADYRAWQQERLRELAEEETYQIKREQTAKRDIAREFAKLQKPSRLDSFLDLLGLPISLRSSIDLPFLRQGIIPFVTHPGLTYRAFITSMGTWTEAQMERKVDALEQSGMAELARASGLKQSSLETRRAPLSRLAREEQFQNRFAQKFPHVRVSERQYTIGMDSLRLALFEKLTSQLMGKYKPARYPEVYEDLAREINIWTGVGDIGAITKYSPTLNRLVWSTRLIAARIEFLITPLRYATGGGGRGGDSGGGTGGGSADGNAGDPRDDRLPDPVRRIAIQHWLQFMGTMAGLFGVAALFGLTSLDLDDENFLKFHPPGTNQHWDLTGGLAQYVRLFGKLVRSVYRKATHRMEFAGDGIVDNLAHFARGKLAPAPATAVDAYVGKTFTGEPFQITRPLLESFVPMAAGDIYDGIKLDGAAGFIQVPFVLLGGGSSTYRSRKMADSTGTEAERIARGLLAAKTGNKPETVAEYQRRSLITEYVAARKANRSTDGILKDLGKVGGPLTDKETETLGERISQTPLEHAYRYLDPDSKEKVMAAATPAEKARLEPSFDTLKSRVDALRDSAEFKAMTEQEQKEAVREMYTRERAAIKKNPTETEKELDLRHRKELAHDEARAALSRRPDFKALTEDQQDEVAKKFGMIFRPFAVPERKPDDTDKDRDDSATSKMKLLDDYLKPGKDGKNRIESMIDSFIKNVKPKAA